MFGILSLVSLILGIAILWASAQETSLIGTIIGLVMLIIGVPVFLAIDYYNTETTYKVEMQTQETLSANGKDYAVRLRIYKDGKYYDIEMPIDEYHGETELTFTKEELSKYK